MREKDRKYYAQHRQDILSAKKDYYQKHKEARHEKDKQHHLKKRYNLTIDAYNVLLEVQNGGCAICGKAFLDSMGRKLAVDHSHKTGRIRGLLCLRCNIGLGSFLDSAELMTKAIEYLRRNHE